MDRRQVPDRALLPGLCLLLGLALSCGRDDRPAPDVVLITVDTLRADHLEPYGSSRTATPHVARLAAEGVVFDQAAAPMPTTRPSHATLFTGRHPRQHGVTDNHLVLPEEETTLGEVFREAGYRTGASLGVSFLGRASGIPQGVETILAKRAREDVASAVVERAVGWLRGLGPDERFFLWVHLFDPHMSYAPPAFFTPPATGGAADLDEVSWPSLREAAAGNGGDLDGAVAERARQLYAGEVESVDAALGVLFLELEERGRGDETLIVLTADHGECMENGFFFRHGDCLYDGAVKAPLIFHFPGRLSAGARVAGQVEHMDVASTLLTLAGIEPPPSFEGRSLFGRDGDPVDLDPDRYALVQLHVSAERLAGHRPRVWRGIESVAGVPMLPPPSGAEQLALRNARWKYLARSEGAEELYDLSADPHETRDLAGAEPVLVRRLRGELRRRLDGMPLRIQDSGDLSPELRRELEALGYL